MFASSLRNIYEVMFLGKVVNRDKSKNKNSKKKAIRFARATIKSNKSVNKDKTRYGGSSLPW